MAYTDIDKPSDYFNTVLYTGNATGRTITGVGFQPDWVWGKVRSEAQDHVLVDSIRGATKQLYSSDSAAEQTEAQGLTGFDSDGFTLGTHAYFNGNSKTYVAWNWKAGTSFTNDASGTGIGSIDSAGSVNTDAGFSIVSWTGTGSAGTIKHGLSTAPSMIIIKNRSSAYDWTVGHNSLGWTNVVFLNATTASQGDTQFNNTAPTSSVFSIGTPLMANKSGDSIIAYCFSEKKGYSKFSSFVGNGNADGTFIYTGFKPAWVMWKRTDATNDWYIYDNKRNSFNTMGRRLEANQSDAEVNSGSAIVDFLSNGYKFRGTDPSWNVSGGNFIYMAFAEESFVSSSGVPATAR